jgi:hypothetical protein
MEDAMTVIAHLPQLGLSSSYNVDGLPRSPKRNLGCSILVAAIEDYMGMDEQSHASASQFLFPSTAAYQEHYDWVVSMADGLDRAWLRDALDRAKAGWDKDRLRKQLKATLERETGHRISV